MLARNRLFFVVLVCWTCLHACVLDTITQNESAQILSFDLLKALNPGLTEDVIGVVTDTTITLNVPPDTDLTSLLPTIQHTGEQILPDPSERQDFTDAIYYSAVAADGSLHTYSVTVIKGTVTSDSKQITAFRIDNIPGVINGTDIVLTLPYGTDVSKLTAYVGHTGASIVPASGSLQDFTNPVQYTVTAKDSSSATYTVTVVVAASNAKEITTFSIGAATAEITSTQISLTLPNGTNLNGLMPTIVHTGVSISPESGSAQNFSEPVMYTVTAGDNSTKTYTVTVSVGQSGSKEITKFIWNGRAATINNNAITLTVPFGTDVTHVAPVISHTGKSISPAMGDAVDFSQPVKFTVTAADGSKREYTVTVTIAPDTAHEITELTILGIKADIKGAAITLTVPFGTERKGLVPTITHTGAKISPESDRGQDFNLPVVYTVTAADNSTKQYTVTVSVAPSDAREIKKFILLGAEGVITNTSIAVTLPIGSDVKSVSPAVTFEGTSIDPPMGTFRDFSSPVVYTVTAASGKTQPYTVTVTVLKNTEKDITGFSIGDALGFFGPNSVALTLPYNTDRMSLEPKIALSPGASVAPKDGDKQDFRTPATYKVTAENASTKDYQVIASVAYADTKQITHFSINGVAGAITADKVILTLPNGTDVTKLKPTIAIAGKSISPKSGDQEDFTSPKKYTVTPDDNNATPKDYMVEVKVAGATDANITGFSIMGVPGVIAGNTVTLELPSGTDRSRLRPVVQSEGISVTTATPAPLDFSTPQTYTVHAADPTITKVYTVSVSLSSPDEKDIQGFDLFGIAPTFGSNSISVTVPAGTDLKCLMPIVKISGASVSPASGQAVDFSNSMTVPVVYTVHDTTTGTHAYAVTVVAQ